MKLILLFVCTVLAHVNAQSSCGCSKPSCRPLPPCPRPSTPRTCAPIPRTCPPTYEVQEYRPLTPFAVPYEVSPVSPLVALPSCNCPTVPSLPVSPQILPAIQASPFLTNLGCISPCLGGVPDFLSPLGMINPFLPAASPVSALAPTVSSLYPPINPCGCGCNYLKKIPIPPPFL